MASRENCRPDPDQLLRKIQAQEEHDARGRLKIFLGYAPRVGKSQRMLDEGRRRRKRGQDVVIGAIQSKGSEELAELIREFEVIPTRGDPLTGGAIDVDAVIARAPQVCLIDELARVNPEGSRHVHRWEDVDELRAHGINVISAINLQHVREEQDAVERITGRHYEHSVPECFIQSADEIAIVDVPAEACREHGARELSPAQLSELREMALLLAAHVVEEQLQNYMDEHGIQQSWGMQERILVCMTPRSSARAMLESAARAAARFHGQLLAVYVRQPDTSREAAETIEQNLELARKFGAEVHIIEGSDPMSAIIRFAHEQRVTQIFVGHSGKPSWKFWTDSPVDRLLAEAEGIDVRLFPHAA